MEMWRKAQVSMEYLTLMGFTLLLLIPIIYIFSLQSAESSEDVGVAQTSAIGDKIIEAADQVYYLGEPSKTTLKAYFPDAIENVTIVSNALVFTLETRAGISDMVKISRINLTGSLSPVSGFHEIVIQATENGVTITDS
ncbi:hypothetical protein HYW21_00120 [Candidatus Woesearchaeota archaeon]|nr:hypothetical protein [Candidatus Woesearchaeota archaeon]